MEGQLDGNIKEERSKALIELNAINEKSFNEKYVGRDMDVLLEQEVKGKEGIFEGYTRNYIKVEVRHAKREDIGNIINCKIDNAVEDYLEGLKV